MTPDSTKDDAVERCREKALRLLTQRAHSREELRRKLRARGMAPNTIARVTEDLARVRLLDDRAYAQAYSEQRMTGSRPVGRTRISLELRKRGVPGEIIEQVLAEQAEGAEPDKEFERAREAGQRKWESVRHRGEPRAAMAKVYRFLAGRGFSGEICSRVVASLRDNPD